MKYFKLSLERIRISCCLIFLASNALFKHRNKRKIRLIVFPRIQYPLFYQSNKIFLLKRIRECIDSFSGFVTLLEHKNNKKIRIAFLRQCNLQFSFDQIKKPIFSYMIVTSLIIYSDGLQVCYLSAE